MTEKDLPYSSSVKEFCDRWGLHVSTFYRKPEEFPSTILIGPGARRITREAELAWLDERRQQSDIQPELSPKYRKRQRLAKVEG